jgi:iron complex transport system substrate-binding protein
LKPENRSSLRRLAVVTILLALPLLACYRQVAPPRELQVRSFTDDLGRTVKVPEKIESVVSLAPNLTEIVFAVGGGDLLVGVTTFCNYPADAKSIRKVGDTQKPNIETIIALKPQIVFVSTASQLEAFMKTLDQQNIAVFVAGPNTLDDIYKSIEKIGQIVGNPQKAENLVQDLKSRASAARGTIVYGSLPKVFVQIDKDSLYTIGRDSYITDIVARAGGVSATADLATAYPKISRETALAMNPDVIIVSESEGNHDPNEAFRNSPAVKKGKVYRINADLLSRPGPRVVDALEQIAEKLKSERQLGSD